MIVPLRLKLGLLTSALLVFGIGTASLLVLERATEALEQEARKRGRFLAISLAQNARDPLLLEDDLVLSKLVETVAEESEVLAVRLLDKSGAVVADSGSENVSGYGRLAADSPLATRILQDRLTVASRMAFQEVDLGEAQVVLDLHAIVGAVVERAQRSVLLASGGLLAVGLLIAFATSGRITRPLRRLRFAVNALAAGDTSARVEVTTRDEVADLTRAFNDMSESLSQKNRVETAFRRYVSDHVLREVLDSPDAVRGLGERREVTLLFIDIREFSRMASWTAPERLVAFLNETFELITNRLLEHGATVDKYIGDAILAYFGAPIETPDHPERAVAAAIAIQRSVKERNAKCEASGLPFDRLNLGIGIQTGPVVVGNIGSELKMDYTVIGDPVNVVNRLQKLAGPGEIVVAEAVASRVGDRAEFEPMGERRLEGRDEPVATHRVVF